jgi:serine protease Do
MTLDSRSFKVGIIAGVFLVVGVLTGVGLSVRYDWQPIAQAKEQAAVVKESPGVSAMGLPNFVPVAKIASPAVVNISTSRVIKAPQGGGQDMQPFMDDPFFRHFFGDEFQRRFQIPKDRRENSLGSGVIVSSDGYIVTNNHVIAKADEIQVLLGDKREFKGKVIGTDPKSDIAVIKIDAKDLPTIPWGDSDKLEVGEFVLAVGNPFGLNQTVTFGIVSAVGRSNVGITDYEDFIQTDVAINPGNSGGALVNARGELVGINTAIFSRSGGNMGIGFAVPASMTRTVMNSLIKNGKVVRGWLGVSIQPLTRDLAKQFGIKETDGALINEVIPGSPAADVKLQSGDVILTFDGKRIDSPTTLRNVVAATPIGKTVKVEVLREKKPVTYDVKITEQPKDMTRGAADPEDDEATEESKGSALTGLEVRNLTPDIVRQLGLNPDAAGVVVVGVAGGSNAEASGIQQGDVIVEVNRKPVRNIADYRKVVDKLNPKEDVLLLMMRRGGRMFVTVKPG